MQNSTIIDPQQFHLRSHKGLEMLILVTPILLLSVVRIKGSLLRQKEIYGWEELFTMDGVIF